jgi:hypothetical protein
MPKCQKPANYCPINFALWTPGNDSMLDYEWTPLPKRKHFPLKVRAHRVGLKIAAEELAFMRQRLAAIGAEIQAEQSLEHFRQELDGLQGKVRELLGVTL